VFRIAVFILFSAAVAGFTQTPTQIPQPPAPAAPDPISQPVADAESAMVKSDWKAAEALLTPWLSAHPADSRALFDAGYVADAQNHLDDAAALYRRAIEADPKSFESHLSLGLLLARQNNKDTVTEAHQELVLATTLDPGDAGPAMKARAWRALARLDQPTPARPGDTTEASNDLLEALKLSPETPADTLLAANLADQAGEYADAEAAYRRVLAADPKSAAANAGLAHILIVRKQYPEAETFLRAALEQAPDDPALTAQLALALAAQDKAEALPLLEKLHQAHPNEQGHPVRPGQPRRLEWPCLRRVSHQSAFHHAARSYHAVKIPSRAPFNLLSLGHILRFVAQECRSDRLLPPFPRCSSRKVPKSGVAGSTASHFARKKAMK
jgi:tetratricopeptide (TPR) repeat protein